MQAKDFSPDTRRAIMVYAAQENIDYDVAVECLINEGIKALYGGGGDFMPPVNNAVNSSIITL